MPKKKNYDPEVRKIIKKIDELKMTIRELKKKIKEINKSNEKKNEKKNENELNNNQCLILTFD